MTERGYRIAVSDLGGRRQAQKARTRARILAVAQDLFAARGFETVPITEIAAAAEVSVQTVFNHFTSKEELFFADRAAWVEGPARAVRARGSAHPMDALRRHLVGTVEGYVRAAVGDPRHQRMIAVLDSTPALLGHERSLHEQAVVLLAGALADAWGCPDDDPAGRVLAEVTASVWLAAIRSIVMGMRSAPPAAGNEKAVRSTVELTERVLADLASGLTFATGTHAQAAEVA